MTAKEILIKRILDDFKQVGYRKKGVLLPIENGSKIVGKQNRRDAQIVGVPISACDIIWIGDFGMKFIRVKLSQHDGYVKTEKIFDAQQFVVDGGTTIVWDVDSWRSWFGRKLKEIKKNAK